MYIYERRNLIWSRGCYTAGGVEVLSLDVFVTQWNGDTFLMPHPSYPPHDSKTATLKQLTHAQNMLSSRHLEMVSKGVEESIDHDGFPLIHRHLSDSFASNPRLIDPLFISAAFDAINTAICLFICHWSTPKNNTFLRISWEILKVVTAGLFGIFRDGAFEVDPHEPSPSSPSFKFCV